jgi:hypothetical protein
MSKTILLASSIILAILTTVMIFLCFCFLNANKTSLIVICTISLAGYLTSALYFLSYKEQK